MLQSHISIQELDIYKIIKQKLSPEFKQAFKRNFNRIVKPRRKKVFCISIQRTGTTSVGDFLDEHGYHVARWTDSKLYNWSYLSSIGNYEAIFNSNTFKAFNAYEDDPWWYRDNYRILFHRFPKSKFILFYRNSDDWFDSMLRHSQGKTLDNTYRHCKFYRRLPEYYNRLDNQSGFNPEEKEVDNLMRLEGKRAHYIQIYEEYNRDVKDFFNKYGRDRFFFCSLEDTDKWSRLGNFLELDVDRGYDIHAHKSK